MYPPEGGWEFENGSYNWNYLLSADTAVTAPEGEWYWSTVEGEGW